jgi:hypothetical protein
LNLIWEINLSWIQYHSFADLYFGFW